METLQNRYDKEFTYDTSNQYYDESLDTVKGSMKRLIFDDATQEHIIKFCNKAKLAYDNYYDGVFAYDECFIMVSAYRFWLQGLVRQISHHRSLAVSLRKQAQSELYQDKSYYANINKIYAQAQEQDKEADRLSKFVVSFRPKPDEKQDYAIYDA